MTGGMPVEMIKMMPYGDGKCLIDKETSYELYINKQMYNIIYVAWPSDYFFT